MQNIIYMIHLIFSFFKIMYLALFSISLFIYIYIVKNKISIKEKGFINLYIFILRYWHLQKYFFLYLAIGIQISY